MNQGKTNDETAPIIKPLPSNPTRTILLVEDDPLFRDGLARFMRSLGAEVIATEHGADALELLRKRKNTPHLVLQDLTLADIDGIQLIDNIREINPKLKIVVVSGRPQKELKQPLDTRNVQAYLEKPFKMTALADTLRNALEEHTDSPHEKNNPKANPTQTPTQASANQTPKTPSQRNHPKNPPAQPFAIEKSTTAK